MTQTVKILPNSSLNSEPEFPTELLPKWLKKTVKEHAESYGTPEELWAMAFLSGISSASGKNFRMITGNYTNYPQLWLMVVGASGTGKSDPFRIAYKPILEQDKENYIKFQSDFKEWEANDKQGHAPRWKQTCINDTTPEALYNVLKYSENGLTLYRDELSGFFQDIGRYASSGEVGHYLSIFNNASFSVNRKSDKPLFIDEPLMNIVGTIQPGILSEVMSKNSADQAGFSQRFLYMFPDFPPRKYNLSTVNLSTENYNIYINALLRLDEPCETRLSNEAEKIYANFYAEMETKRAKSDDFWASIYSKAQIQVLRLALIIFIAREPEFTANEVGTKDVQCAIGMMRYFLYSMQQIKLDTKTISKKQLVDGIFLHNPNATQAEVARVLNVSRQYINRLVDRLTVNTSSNTVIDEETEKTDVNQQNSENNIEKKEVDSTISVNPPINGDYNNCKPSTCQPVNNYPTMDEAIKMFTDKGFEVVERSYGN